MQIRSTIDNGNKAMLDVQSITDKIQKGEGSVGMLVHDDRFYTKLSSASEELDALIGDLKTNLGKYLKLLIFGKKDTRGNAFKLGLPELGGIYYPILPLAFWLPATP